MKQIIGLIGIIIICLFTAPYTFTKQNGIKSSSKSFIWEVKSENTTVYILGSIHLAKPSLYPLSDNIEKAFDDSSRLVLEINPLTVDNARIQEMIIQDGIYPEGDSIKNHIKPEVLEMLDNYLKDSNISVEMVQNMKPGLLSITLSMYHMSKLGYSSEYGIDNYFVYKAKDSKEILELETTEDQISLLLNMPDGNLFLEYTLMEIHKIEEYLQNISETWKSGDAEGMYEYILKPYEDDIRLKPVINKLFYERNMKMTSKIKQYLDTADKYFVVVGAGHLLGDDGIINLLRKEGYKVRQF